MQSSLSVFAQKYLHKCKDTYFILQNKNLCIYEDSFGAKILRDDCTLCLDSSELFMSALLIFTCHQSNLEKLQTCEKYCVSPKYVWNGKTLQVSQTRPNSE